MSDTPLLWTYDLHDISEEHAVWIHLDANHDHAATWLQKCGLAIDEITIQALTSAETRPRADYDDETLLVILRGINLNKESDPEDMVSLRIYLHHNHIITLSRRPLKTLGDIKTAIASGRRYSHPQYLFTDICTQLIRRMQPTMAALQEKVDELEEALIDAQIAVGRSDMIRLQKQCILLRRYMLPQREVVYSIIHDQPAILHADTIRQLQENYDDIAGYTEMLDVIRDRLHMARDELSSQLSDRLNRNMYVLSIITTIFLPLGFLTGLLGINVGGIPGTESPHAFTYVTVTMFVLVCIQVVIFRKLKWL